MAAVPGCPSVSDQPEYEVRTAALEVEGEQDVRIWWIHVYATGDVDLIAVTNRQPST